MRTRRCVHHVLSKKEKLQSNISSSKSKQTILHNTYAFTCACVSTDNEVEKQTLNFEKGGFERVEIRCLFFFMNLSTVQLITKEHVTFALGNLMKFGITRERKKNLKDALIWPESTGLLLFSFKLLDQVL